MDKSKKNGDDWLRLPSKSHPGHFYLFNKATGETQWLPSKNEEEIKNMPSPKLTVNTISKTPAQDRLKRLQHSLKTSQTKSNVSQSKHYTTDSKSKTSTEQENVLKDNPSTSSAAKVLAKSPRKSAKRSYNASFSDDVNRQTKTSKSSILENHKEMRILGISTLTPSTPTIHDSTAIKPSLSTHSADNANVDSLAETNTSKLSNIRSGIVKKIKEICKIPFNLSKKLNSEKPVSKTKNSSTLKTTKFKATSKAKTKPFLSKSAAQKTIINHTQKEKDESTESVILTNISVPNTPKNQSVPSYPRGSANLRLQRLKQSLLSQQQSNNAKNISETSTYLSTKLNVNTSTKLPGSSDDISDNNSNYKVSLNDTANSTVTNAVEAMDWQPIAKDEEPAEKSVAEPTLVIEKSTKCLLNKTKAHENQTMGDIIDTVNENLLRFAAEKQKESINNKGWRKDFYYFVVDTNVLLRDLTFLEDLSKMKLCETQGCMLYIPYSVLQELDKLKMRTGSQEGVKTLAVRAIKYLNSKFENNSPYVQAQSALDERNHLIDINSADDSIINCCLQAKKHVKNIILLTEDINLRNKAICNNVMVSAKSDLVAKRYDLIDKS